MTAQRVQRCCHLQRHLMGNGIGFSAPLAHWLKIKDTKIDKEQCERREEPVEILSAIHSFEC